MNFHSQIQSHFLISQKIEFKDQAYYFLMPLLPPSQIVSQFNHQQYQNMHISIDISKRILNTLHQKTNQSNQLKNGDQKSARNSQQDKKQIQINIQNNQNEIQDQNRQEDQEKDSQYELISHMAYYKTDESKNSQPNIINQIISFIKNKHKSKKILEKIFEKDYEKIKIFQDLITLLFKKAPNYRGRIYLYEIMVLLPKSKAFRLINNSPKRRKQTVQSISVKLSEDQFKKAFRILVFYFLNNQCTQNILLSRKMNKGAIIQHLWRKREIKRIFSKCLKKGLHPREVQIEEKLKRKQFY